MTKCCGKDCKIKDVCFRYVPVIDSGKSNAELYSWIFAEFKDNRCRNFIPVASISGVTGKDLCVLLDKICEVNE